MLDRELELDTYDGPSPPCIACGRSDVYVHLHGDAERYISFHCRSCDYEWDKEWGVDHD